MPKPTSSTRFPVAKAATSAPDLPVFEHEAATVQPVSPILYQVQSADRSGYVSILSQRLPEPTSYSGRNIIALNFEDEIYKEHPNQARLLAFDGHSTLVDCGNPPHLQSGGASSLTIEAWIKADNRGSGYQHIVSHGQSINEKGSGEVFLRIDDGRFQFGTWDGKGVAGVGNEQTEVRNEDLKNWVHLAGVYDHAAKTYILYRNGTRIASEVHTLPPQAVDNPWYIGAMWEVKAQSMVRYFRGYIAEVRIWTAARTEAEIRRYMLDPLPPTGLGQLGAYWRLNDGNGSKAVDSSGCECNGAIRGALNWTWTTSPVGELSRLLQRQPNTEAERAFKLAKETGFFDSLVFPRIRGVMTQPERKRAKEAIRDLELDTFKAFYESGHHLILRRGFSGATEYSFVQNPPPTVKPHLALVEEYRLSSFLGSYGVGRTVKSFSLLPGESTRLTIKTASKSTTAAKQSQSILDSYSQESASDFESSLAEEKSDRTSSSSELSYHASVEGSDSWGFGGVTASAGVGGSSNSAREEFAKSVASATSKHASKASANRNVQIDTTTETTVTEEKESEIVRNIENINVGRTLNFVFCQMNQEVISLLHLIDVRVGYTDGIEPIREMALYELPELLEQVLIDDPKTRKTVQQWIEAEVRRIRDHRGKEVEDFVVPVKDAGAVERWTVNRDFASEFIEPATKTAALVPGIIISSQSIVMRTEDVAVDSLVGQGAALDSYSERLQEEENRRKKLANDTSEVQIRLLESEVVRNETMLELVKNKDVELLKAYANAMRFVPPGNPTQMVGVWQSDSASAKSNGQPPTNL